MGISRFAGRILRRRRLKAASGSVRVQDELRDLTTRFCIANSLALKSRRAGQLFGFLLTSPNERTSVGRVVQWIRLLEQDDELRERFQAAWRQTLIEMESVSLFTESGLPGHNALPAEIQRRLFERLLPSARHENDMGRLFASIFASSRAVSRFVNQPGFIFERMVRLLWPGDDPDFAAHLQGDLRQSLCLLATRVAGRAATEAVRARGSNQKVEESRFYQLLFQTHALVNATSAQAHGAELSAWQLAVFRCREELNQIHLHMEDAGVSSALVYDLRSIESTLNRMQLLAEVLEVRDSSADRAAQLAARELLSALIRGRLEDTRLSSLLGQNLNLLARKTVERTGHGGEHYIAHTQHEYALMWRAAIGGGLLTVFTAAIKMRVIEQHLSLFAEGLLISANYSISFILLQICGFALATKQPSMTAATLAGIIRENRGDSRWSKTAEFAADICRTQLAAAFGNILAVCAGAVVFEKFWSRMFKTHYLPAESAQHVYSTLHPFESRTALFAAFTGVLLWMAAVIGGWCENFVVYHRIPEAILQHPLGRRIGPRTMKHLADWLENNVASYSTSIVLGLLLGFAPVFARFFGVSLDVRHVTLSTGTLALAAARFGTASFGHGWLYAAIAGIGITFVLNLSVSFAIASIVALRAYDIPFHEQTQILKFIVKEFFQSPLEFIVPVKPDVITISTAPDPLHETPAE